MKTRTFEARGYVYALIPAPGFNSEDDISIIFDRNKCLIKINVKKTFDDLVEISVEEELVTGSRDCEVEAKIVDGMILLRAMQPQEKEKINKIDLSNFKS